MNNKLFQKNDVMVIKGYESLTDNQLDLIKGGITASFVGCECSKSNYNNGNGDCVCGKGNTNKSPQPIKI